MQFALLSSTARCSLELEPAQISTSETDLGAEVIRVDGNRGAGRRCYGRRRNGVPLRRHSCLFRRNRRDRRVFLLRLRSSRRRLYLGWALIAVPRVDQHEQRK